MTGFAAKTIQINSLLLQMELKSVNHRFVDITIKSNEEFRPLENTLRTALSDEITRGKIDFKCFIKDTPEQKQLVLNEHLLNQYLGLAQKINTLSNNPAPIAAIELLALPGIFQQQNIDLDTIQQDLIAALKTLLSEYKSTQATEGEKLFNIISERLKAITQIVTEAIPLLDDLIDDYKERSKQRLIEAIGESNVSDTRLQQEFAFFCQKVDIHEEMDRLSAHVTEFTKLLNKGGAIGKRLDFICQEMHREANTFGSKSISIHTTQKSVDLKVLIEQIREQVQNIM